MKTFKVGDQVRLSKRALADPTISTTGLENQIGTILAETTEEVFDIDWNTPSPISKYWTRWHMSWLTSADPNYLELRAAERKWEKYFATPRG